MLPRHMRWRDSVVWYDKKVKSKNISWSDYY